MLHLLHNIILHLPLILLFPPSSTYTHTLSHSNTLSEKSHHLLLRDGGAPTALLNAGANGVEEENVEDEADAAAVVFSKLPPPNRPVGHCSKSDVAICFRGRREENKAPFFFQNDDERTHTQLHNSPRTMQAISV